MWLIDYAVDIYQKMHRTRKLAENNLDTELDRCLSPCELAFIGLSAMVSGVFIITSTVIHNLAGPGIVISYLLAGTAAVLSALAYAEIGSRIPRAGSSFVYASVTLGEIWGFLAGWNMILEYSLSAAAMARTFTSTVASMISSPNISDTIDVASFEVLGQRTDIIAVGIVAVFAFIVGLGVKLTSFINIGFNIISMLLVLVVNCLAFVYGSPSNWFKDGLQTFFPHGVGGVVAGAASCYFSFIGFEVITISGEETVNPHKSVPLAILLAFLMATFLFVGNSLAMTYFTSAANFVPNGSLAEVFFNKGFFASGLTLSIAGLLCICTNVIVNLYAIPRVFYAMACDGLIFKWMGTINKRTQTPLYSMIASGIIVCIITFFLDLATLVTMVSIGTLTSYNLVTIGTLLLRYKPFETGRKDQELSPISHKLHDEKKYDALISEDSNNTAGHKLNPGERKEWVRNNRFFRTVWPDVHPKHALVWLSLSIVLLALAETLTMKTDNFSTSWNMVLVMFLLAPIMFWMAHLLLYEQNVADEKTFRMPLMPLIPTLSVWMNTQFMLMLPWETWVRLIVWVTIGLMIYLFYGMKHSYNTKNGELINNVRHIHSMYGTNIEAMPLSDITKPSPDVKPTSTDVTPPSSDLKHPDDSRTLDDNVPLSDITKTPPDLKPISTNVTDPSSDLKHPDDARVLDDIAPIHDVIAPDDVSSPGNATTSSDNVKHSDDVIDTNPFLDRAGSD